MLKDLKGLQVHAGRGEGKGEGEGCSQLHCTS